MEQENVIVEDLGSMEYQQAWDYQESLLARNVQVKSAMRSHQTDVESQSDLSLRGVGLSADTSNHLLFVEHPPVYTLGKSGHMENLLINESQMTAKGIQFFKINRGGDITFHGPGQVVGYPIIDLEKFYTDIGRYLRNIEEVIILTLAEYGIKGERSKGQTGVWIEPEIAGRERKICAIGVRCSRWITMHGFAFNVNTDLEYFNYIVPCGIQDKKVTSLRHELQRPIELTEVKQKVKGNFARVFNVNVINGMSF